MPIKYSTDIIPISEARARLPELLDEVRAGETKIITRNGHAWAALIDVEQLDEYRRMRREQGERELVTSVMASLEDIDEGRVMTADTFFSEVTKETTTRRKARRRG